MHLAMAVLSACLVYIAAPVSNIPTSGTARGIGVPPPFVPGSLPTASCCAPPAQAHTFAARHLSPSWTMLVNDSGGGSGGALVGGDGGVQLLVAHELQAESVGEGGLWEECVFEGLGVQVRLSLGMTEQSQAHGQSGWSRAGAKPAQNVRASRAPLPHLRAHHLRYHETDLLTLQSRILPAHILEMTGRGGLYSFIIYCDSC